MTEDRPVTMKRLEVKVFAVFVSSRLTPRPNWWGSDTEAIFI